ncbi:methylmalonyl Co-A mutase-associated GTPase MeaB [Yersinia enterocolitica]|uniref:methylmalonyl Co-A mutase-associated GTPase MeaB n=1 Tax=Yersinia enterocolitica TaxID=630 RepID=UPI003F427C3F
MITENNLDNYVERVLKGDRVALAQAMTLVESVHPDHLPLAEALLDKLMPYTGMAKRIGVTGTPGAGKSTFLEALGLELISQGNRVAIIAVDPSSPISGGSILGDKTRMLHLAQEERAFIRPVPSGGHLGGISQHVRELIVLCEAAGFDIVIVETVGVGQSETEVSQMVDCFISLQIAGGGDDLQGIKKGIMEMADLIVINKDDGDNGNNVAITRHIYESTLQILRRKYPQWKPRVLTCSAIEKRGIREVWRAVSEFYYIIQSCGQLNALRQKQAVQWINAKINECALRIIFRQKDIQKILEKNKRQISLNELSPRAGLNNVIKFIERKF